MVGLPDLSTEAGALKDALDEGQVDNTKPAEFLTRLERLVETAA